MEVWGTEPENPVQNEEENEANGQSGGSHVVVGVCRHIFLLGALYGAFSTEIDELFQHLFAPGAIVGIWRFMVGDIETD